MTVTRPRSLLLLLTSVAILFIGSVVATMASASEATQPLGVTAFTMQTTSPTKITTQGEYTEFSNEPYVFSQAGGHPWALTTSMEFATEEVEVDNVNAIEHLIEPVRDPKDIVVDLPPGLVGNPTAVPRCTLTQALAGGNPCPPATQVGTYRIRWFGGREAVGPIVDVIPEKGQSAEFALENEAKVTAVVTGHLVRTSQGYGLAVTANEIPSVEISKVETTFWGVPADSSHTAMRGLFCGSTVPGTGLRCKIGTGNRPDEETPVPFLTMPADCAAGQLSATMRADSWEEPGQVKVNSEYQGYVERSATLTGATGCNLLQFNPSFTVEPDTLTADEPVGVGLNLEIPQDERPEANATPQLRNTTVTLPEGMSVSPGIVDGIEACEAFGPEGIDITGPESEEVGLNGELQLASGHCPSASTVGTAEAITPLLSVPIKGHIYLARPGCGAVGQHPCTEEDARDGNLYRLYLELGGTGELAATGVHFKVPLETEANPATGQLSTKVLGTPQTPFSDLKIHLNGGPRAPLANPAVCGPALTTTDFTPWSAPGITPAPQSLATPGTPDATPSTSFQVGGCASAQPFVPGFTAGTVTTQGGAFSAFTTSFSRQDREQYVKGIQVHTPPGLLGLLSSVTLCGEPAANEGTCSESSKIGTTHVASGAGSHPFEIGGNVYLTNSYDGAPFGLSIVTNVVAGPFNLGLVVVRARIDVDPGNSTLTVTTDETGPHAVPQVIFGVPLRLQRVTVNIDRPRFMFNPTNCGHEQITAKISGSQNAVATVATPFAAGGCRSLSFKPKFAVTTNAKTSRAKGASLDVKLSYPTGSLGSAANIKSAKVELPKQLPSRLTTLQQACPARVFDVNAANCPQASIVGIARARTPLLPVLLSGPVYFVSHGGEAFPSLVVVLQGDGVRVDLTGATFISKKKEITSSTFRTVPDVPVNTFELYLPQGKFSALAAIGNLCSEESKLVMPTTFVAQNGAQIKQKTKIAVNGCGGNKAKSARKGLRRGVDSSGRVKK